MPDPFLNAHFWGIGGTIETVGGGKKLSAAATTAHIASAYADHVSYEAGQAARIGSYSRREQDWAFQSNLAAGDISQIFKQIRGAEIRQAIAEMELKNHRQQMKHAEEIERFLNEEGTEKNGKKTNKSLYAWMKREVKGLYSHCFQFAFDVAKKSERALQHELGKPDLTYLQFGYLAGKEGLLAGEKLYFDIKRMEMAYHDLNQREYELTRHVSLLQVDPLALLQLRATGRCTVTLPETLFDMDGPGHYFRRIKTVSVSIPCVTGPYASVNCTLTLLKSSIRTTQSPWVRRVRARKRRGRTLHRLLRQPAIDRDELGAERQRPVRNQSARRALFAVRKLRGGQRMAVGAAGQSQQGRAPPVRLQDDQRRHPAHPLHRP